MPERAPSAFSAPPAAVPPVAAPLFSVVVPTCERPDLLAACLDCLAPGRQTFSAGGWEVIVTDDGTKARAADLLRARFPWVRWTDGPRRGPAANRNHGAAQARGTWLAFTDDDCLPDPGWLAAYAAVASTDVAVLEGRTYANGPRRHPWDLSPINDAGGNLWSCNFAIRRELFRELGGFDERFPYAAMEDMELHVRLVRAQHHPRFVAGAAVLHPWRRVADWTRLHRRRMKSQVILEALHPGWGFRATVPRLFWHNLRELAGEHLAFFFRQPREALRVLPAIWRAWALEIRLHRERPRPEEFEP